MTRIIAGAYGGRRIATPSGLDTRPTSDRVREALFSRLEHEVDLDGALVLDLFAGSGALGFEAASRGASQVVLVEQAKDVVSLLRSSIDALGVGAVVTVRPGSVAGILARPCTTPFTVVFADPPYSMDEAALARVLASLAEGGWVGADTVVVVERSTRSPEPTWPPGLSRFDERRYGETVLWWAESSLDDGNDGAA